METTNLKKIASLIETLSVLDKNNIRSILKLIDTNQRKETLGIAMAPDGNMKDKEALLSKKEAKWIEAMRRKSLLIEELFLAISSTIIKMLEYLLYSTTFSEVEANSLVKLTHYLMLPRGHI